MFYDDDLTFWDKVGVVVEVALIPFLLGVFTVLLILVCLKK